MKKVFSGCYLVLALAFIYVPIFVLVIYSFTDSKIIGDWNGFSLELYEKLFTDEKLTELYASAEELYLAKEYKRAASTYKEIIAAQPDDPAAYWGAILSRFGIEYLSVPGSEAELRHTVKATFSLLQAPYYLALLRIARPEEKEIFQQEAERIR